MAKPKPGNPKGVLNPSEGYQYFTLNRFEPSKKISFFVEHYWVVQWELPENQTYQQEILSYPSVHLVFEHGKTKIYGVVTGKFGRRLTGNGKVLGIKFRPGGFYPFYKKSPVSSFSDATLPLMQVFAVEPSVLEEKILSATPAEKMIEPTEQFLKEFLPPKDDKVQEVNRIINAIITDQSLIKVDQITAQFNIGKRSLQRLFKRYVGVSPKWVIIRFRLQEAAALLAENKQVDKTQLALDLGYFDQAHFVKDFKSIVGKTPAEYAQTMHPES